MELSNWTKVTNTSNGFTLLEVLVALVIVGLGMMAVFDQLSQMLVTTARLRDKTFANWIASDRITELQVNGQYPKVGETDDDIEMARADWTYTVKISQVPDMDLRRVDVTVSFADLPDDILAEVSGFVSPPQTSQTNIPAPGPEGGEQSGGPDNSSAGNAFGSGYTPLDANNYSRGEIR